MLLSSYLHPRLGDDANAVLAPLLYGFIIYFILTLAEFVLSLLPVSNMMSSLLPTLELIILNYA